MKEINGIIKISDIANETGLTRRSVIAICAENNVNVACANNRYYIDAESYFKVFKNGCCEQLKECNKREKDRSKTTGSGTEKYKGRVRKEELSKEQRKRREADRNRHPSINNEIKGYGVLIYVSEYVKQLPYRMYVRERDKAYKRQMYRAYTGVKGNASEVNFIYDIDLEKMFNNGYEQKGIKIEHWWDGEIRHWTVKDGVWRNEK